MKIVNPNSFFERYRELFEEYEMINKLVSDDEIKYLCYSKIGSRTNEVVSISYSGLTLIEFHDFTKANYIRIYLPKKRVEIKNSTIKFKNKNLYKYANIPLGYFKKFFLESIIGYGGEALE